MLSTSCYVLYHTINISIIEAFNEWWLWSHKHKITQVFHIIMLFYINWSSTIWFQEQTFVYIFSVKTVSKYYTQQHSPAFTCFFDASKAIDKINHIKLFRKLLYRETPIVIVIILLFWYSKHAVCMKWGRCISGYFSISNGVWLSGNLFTKLFSVYIDDLSDKLVKCKVECYGILITCVWIMFCLLMIFVSWPLVLLLCKNWSYDFRVQKDLSF